MSKQKWQIGARAAIMCSEHFENQNRVVTLEQGPYKTSEGHTLWGVEDGKEFTGYDGRAADVRGSRGHRSKILGIEQWKLRLLDDGEDVVISDGIEYTVNA